MKGKIYIKTIPGPYENRSIFLIGEVVEIMSHGGDVKMVICNKENSVFFVREARFCMRIKSLDDPTPYYEKKKKDKHLQKLPY